MERARANSQQLLSADLAARIAHEDRVQAKAALLPSVNWQNGFSYTQPNGPDNSLTFVPNDGAAHLHQPGQRACRCLVARRSAPIIRWPSPPRPSRAPGSKSPRRGLIAVVVQNFYGMAVAQRRYRRTRSAACRRPRQFVEITQQAGGGRRSRPLRRRQGATHARPAGARPAGGATRRTIRRASVSPSSSSRISGRISPWPTIWTASRRCPPFPEIEALAQQKQSRDPRRAGRRHAGNVRHQERALRLPAHPLRGLLLWHSGPPVRAAQ